MTYATQSDMIERFGQDELVQLTDRSGGPAASIDSAVLARALADADETIDAYLGARYAVPVSPAPRRIVRAACDLTRYYLHDDAAPERVKAAYTETVGWLKDVAAGRATLITDTGAALGLRSDAQGIARADYSAAGTFGDDFRGAFLP